MTRRRLALACTAHLAVLAGCTGASGYQAGEELSGGDTTVFDISRDAFSQPAANLTSEQGGTFQAGNIFNGSTWVVAPASLAQRDGLGPLYNATGCSACHLRDGAGRPPEPGEEMLSMLVRLSVPGQDAHGGPLPVPTYGGQFQNNAIPGVPAEGSAQVRWEEVPGTYDDGTQYSLRRPILEITGLAYGAFPADVMFSARVAAPQYGLGLLEALAEEDIVANADPDDADGDGISGRPNHVWDEVHQATALGRFGWKANVPSIEQQTAGALNGDVGITSSLFPDSSCGAGETECLAAPSGGSPEISQDMFDAIVFYGQTLAVPARRDYQDPTVLRGRALFREAGCDGCHVPSFVTSDHEIAALSGQTIWPYTDLLLHDMGEDLADHRPDYEATGTEWRTPPLWGLGLLETVTGYRFFLHDGRARDFAEAILWHGGEAAAARDSFRAMSADERDALIAFLESM